MITIISSTNQRGSNTARISEQIETMLKALAGSNEPMQILKLEDLPENMVHPDMYGPEGQSAAFASIQDQFITEPEKYLFVIPEYNGSIPGILKTFIDACSVRNYKKTFSGKKAAMVGISSGRAGNLRGMDHLTDILNFLEITVMPQKLPISRIEQLTNPSGMIDDNETLEVLTNHLRLFLQF